MQKDAESTEGKDKEDAKAPVTAPAATESTAKAASPKKPQTKQPQPQKALQKPNGEKVRVTPLVNMTCPDGTELQIGKPVEIPIGEYERLLADARGPFFE